MRSKFTLKLSLLLPAVFAALAVPGAGLGAPSEAAKPFPYDPVCPWGRVANGKGFLIRCLTRTEAASLGVPEATPLGDEAEPDAAATDSRKPGGEKEEGDGEPEKDEAEADQPPEETEVIEVELDPAVADTGSLPKAQASLEKARDRYLECIVENGGMFRDEGELQVRFLVRGRGRAEGVTVKKRRSITEEAGKCIADVVDRRFVGYPESEMVAATLVFSFKKKKR